MAKKYIAFRIHASKDGQYYFNVIAKNGKEIARSSETYKRKASCKKAIYSLLQIAVDGMNGKDVYIDEVPKAVRVN